MWLLQMDEPIIIDVEDADLLEYQEGDEAFSPSRDSELEAPLPSEADFNLSQMSNLKIQDKPSKEKDGEQPMEVVIEKEKEPGGNQAGSFGTPLAPPGSALKSQQPGPSPKDHGNDEGPLEPQPGTSKRINPFYAGVPAYKFQRKRGFETRDMKSGRESGKPYQVFEQVMSEEVKRVVVFQDQDYTYEEHEDQDYIDWHIEEEEDEDEEEWKNPWKKSGRQVVSDAIPTQPHDVPSEGTEANPTQNPNLNQPEVYLIRHDDVQFNNGSTQLGFDSVKMRWKIEDRQFRLHDIKHLPVNKPLKRATVQELVNLVRKRYFGNGKDNFYDYSQEIETEKEREQRKNVLQKFLVCVNETGVLGFNTEGHRKGSPRIMMSVSNFEGTAIIYGDCRHLPEELVEYFLDVSITKVGVGISQDLKELREIDFEVHNWVDIGCVRLALYPPAKACPKPRTPEDEAEDEHQAFLARKALVKELEGLKIKITPENLEKYKKPKKVKVTHEEHQNVMRFSVSTLIHDLKECGLFPGSYRRTPYQVKWRANDYFDEGKFPPAMATHIRENARVMFAYLICTARHIAEDEGWDLEETQIGPIIHEILDIVRGRDPTHLQKTLRSKENYWHSSKEDEYREGLLMLPASGLEITRARQAFADRNEEYFTNEELEKNWRIAKERFKGRLPIDIPANINVFMSRTPFKGRCKNCAKSGHTTEECSHEMKGCQLEHDGEGFQTHSELCCPVLHNYCDLCMSVGHLPQIHFVPEVRRSQLEVRQRYFRNMIKGAWTSLIFLSIKEETAQLVKNKFWRYSHDGVTFRRANITRYALKMDKYAILGSRLESDVASEEKFWWKEESSRREEYAVRINAKNRIEIQPLNRRFYNDSGVTKFEAEERKVEKTRHRNAKRRQQRYAERKDAKKKKTE